MRLVVDADVLIGALDGTDPHHPTARALFTAWRDHQATVLVSVVNLAEVLVAPAADEQLLRAARTAIAALGVALHRPGEPVGVDAAQLRGSHPISLADAFCLATARHADASVASFDQKVVGAAAAEGIPVVRGAPTGVTSRAADRRRRHTPVSPPSQFRSGV